MRKNPLGKYLILELDETENGFYLGRYVRCRENPKSGAMHIVELKDGVHSDEQGVADAYELHKRLGFIGEGQYVMITVSPLPTVKPQINEEAANACQEMLAFARK
jgi:hypothetical protein